MKDNVEQEVSASFKNCNSTEKRKTDSQKCADTELSSNEELQYTKCMECNWRGKALLKHLRMKPSCKSKYDMPSLYAERLKLKKIKKQNYAKTQYAKKTDQKRQYYQENKEKRNKYYEENKELRLKYQRKYDREHKQQKKEYKKLKSHYRKHAGHMGNAFQLSDLKHFKSHVNGWCDWSKTDNSHDLRWENVNKQCRNCLLEMFQLKCRGKWNRTYEVNALHCLSCTQVMCNLCGECIDDYDYYLHFYLVGISSTLKEVAKMCPFRTRTYHDMEEQYFPCAVCSNSQIQEERKKHTITVGTIIHNGIMYRNCVVPQNSFANNSKKILVCPYTGKDETSTVCLKDAVANLEDKVNDGVKWNEADFIPLDSRYTRNLRHQTKFDHMCELNAHMKLHKERRVDVHVIELTLAEAYATTDDLRIIDTLLKVNLESYEQVVKVRSIIPAEKCLGLCTHYHHWHSQEAWLAVVDPKHMSLTIGCYPEEREYPESTIIMKKIREAKETLYMIILTHEGSLVNPVEYFEELPLYPEWVRKSKLLFTWNARSILKEENRSIQEALIRSNFIPSNRYPNYLMNLANSEICSCDCCFKSIVHGINDKHTIPDNGCLLPMYNSPLQEINSPNRKAAELWEVMFKFAWKKLNIADSTDTELTSESESSKTEETETEEETDDSEDSNYV